MRISFRAFGQKVSRLLGVRLIPARVEKILCQQREKERNRWHCYTSENHSGNVILHTKRWCVIMSLILTGGLILRPRILSAPRAYYSDIFRLNLSFIAASWER